MLMSWRRHSTCRHVTGVNCLRGVCVRCVRDVVMASGVGTLHGSLLFFHIEVSFVFAIPIMVQCDLWQGPLCVCVSGSHTRRGDSLCFTVYQMFLLSKEKMRKVNDYKLNMLFWRFWSEVFRGCAFDTYNVALVMFIF